MLTTHSSPRSLRILGLQTGSVTCKFCQHESPTGVHVGNRHAKGEIADSAIVLGCAPGGLSALQFLTKKKEAAALAYGGGTTILLSFLAVFFSPFVISLALPKGVVLTIPYGPSIPQLMSLRERLRNVRPAR